jgi:hypothetical protein
LFPTADAGNLTAGHIWIGAASITIGANAVGNLNSGFDPLANRAASPEIDIVGMGGYHQNSVDILLSFHQISS